MPGPPRSPCGGSPGMVNTSQNSLAARFMPDGQPGGRGAWSLADRVDVVRSSTFT